ncbi:MAG: hypothetical protein NTU95_12105 [Methanothrix sp.]|nr:hypothetical protein [Methanothrix sp.]
MDNKENKSKLRKEIEVLSSVSIKGKLIEETSDTIVIQTNNSLLEIHRDDIKNISKIQSDQETNIVSVSMSRDANIMGKNLTTAGQAAMGQISSMDDGEGFVKTYLVLGNGIVIEFIWTDTGLVKINIVKGGKFPGPKTWAAIQYSTLAGDFKT